MTHATYPNSPRGTMARKTGIIRNFNDKKGFGFVRPDDGSTDCFVHRSEIRNARGKGAFADGTRVEFDVQESERGPRAVDVCEVA